MSQFPQAPSKSHSVAVAVLAFPFLALGAAGSRIANAWSKPVPQPKPVPVPAPVEQRMPDITANLQYQIADRVFSTEVRGRRVSFYQYFAANVIRITCRELRHIKPIEFTPDIADSAALVFDIDGAIQWVRANGLEATAVKQAASKSQARKAKLAKSVMEEPAPKPKTLTPAPAPATAAPLNIVRETGSKAAPFVGTIRSFGITKRTGGRDQKPYTTYAMKLQSETGAYEKEFIGEHLSDLVTEMGLKVGQLVRIQLDGRHHFEVEVDGVMQARSRNHYSIEII